MREGLSFGFLRQDSVPFCEENGMGKRPMLSQLTASSDWCHVLTLRFVLVAAAVAATSYSSESIILPELVRKSMATCGSMLRTSLWKHVLQMLRAMSGRMPKKVRVNSFTAVLFRSAPTAQGAKPITHALKFDCIASNSWFSSSCSKPPL